jgi:hypothetical protein
MFERILVATDGSEISGKALGQGLLGPMSECSDTCRMHAVPRSSSGTNLLRVRSLARACGRHFAGRGLEIAARQPGHPQGQSVALTAGEFDQLVAFAAS